MEAAIRVAQETLQVEDVRLLGPTEPPPPMARTVAIHAPENSQPYGVLAAMPKRPFTANDLSFLEAVANVIAAAIARARIEEQLRLAERRTVEERGRSEQAEAALRERDEFISVAAHELRTPLTALQLKLQGLEHGLAAAREGSRGWKARSGRRNASPGSSIACWTFPGSPKAASICGWRSLIWLFSSARSPTISASPPRRRERRSSCSCRRRPKVPGTACGSSRSSSTCSPTP